MPSSARPEPLRSLAVGQHFNVEDYGATPDDATDDAPAIQAAMNAANAWQQQNHQPVEVDFAPGQYRLYPGYVPGSPPTVLTLVYARDMMIEGNGAQLLVTDPTVGVFSLTTCSNMIVRDFTIDYETLPFTQGYITQIIDSHNFVLDVPAGFPAPSDPQFVNTTQRWGYPIDPLVYGRIRSDANNVYSTTSATPLGGSLYQMSVSTSTSTLRVGDRYVEQARNGGSLIFATNSTQISVIGVTAYAGPSGFVIVSFSDAVNVIDCHAKIKPGRWKSLDADGVHDQSGRVGAWVESSSFEGLSDDVMAFYTLPFAVKAVLSDTQFSVGVLYNRGATVANFGFRHFRAGDHLTFVDPNSGQPLADNVVVTAVDISGQTITVDQPVTGITTGTTSLVTNVYNTDLTGSFLVQGTSFLNGRRYGMFIKASNGQVLNNHFEGLSHEAISIHNDPGWPEGLWGGNILIEGNTFVDNGFEYQYKHQTSRIPGTIGIYAEKLGYLPVNGIYVHPNIQVLDNTFQGWRRAAIAAGNVENLEIRGNHFLAPVDDPVITQNTVIVLTSADGATIADNSRPELTAPDVFLIQDSYCRNVTQTGSLDADGNGSADALSDGILILRYLFDPEGAWNVDDAIGSGATRTTRDAIKTHLDAVRTTALDADGNGSADALSDGILILRYLFDPTGAWNVADALGSGATRTTREAIKGYLDGFNPHAAPAPPAKAAAALPAEDSLPQSQAVPADSPSLAVDTTGPMNTDAEAISGFDADQVRAAISQSLVIGGTGTATFTVATPKSIPDEGSQPNDLRAVDTALESWDQPLPYDVSSPKMPIRPWVLGASFDDDLAADQFWGDGGLDWFLTHPDDVVNDQQPGKIVLPLP